jgi:putative protein-disulfide isomerase
MNKPLLIYCYDAYCGWCYGFSPLIKQIATNFKDSLSFEVLSGGMILPEQPVHIKATAEYIAKAYKQVEEMTGIRFGKDYLWHIFNPDESDWFPNSEKPAIAMAVLKSVHSEAAIDFAADLQYALHFEGRDLTDDEAYRHLLPKYKIPEQYFYNSLKDEKFKEEAYYEFALIKQLKVTGFPSVFIQTASSKFYMVARGYTPYDTVADNIRKVLETVA